MATTAPEPTQLRLPSFEGQEVEEVSIAFGGSVKLNPGLREDREILDALKYGREVKLTVFARASGVSFGLRTDTDGNDQSKSRRRLTVHSIESDSIEKA